MKTFLKAQVSSFIGSVLDYSVMLILTELFGVYFVISTAIGAFVGAILNFTVNRYWVFKALHTSTIIQAPKFALIAGTSILLNTYGTYFFTEVILIDYRISRLGVALLVAIAWNFMLQKYFVFKKKGEIRKAL